MGLDISIGLLVMIALAVSFGYRLGQLDERRRQDRQAARFATLASGREGAAGMQ